jgi:hypothetical protein
MPDWGWILICILGYVLLTRWLLPKLGIPT